MPAPQTLIVQSRQNARVKALRAALVQPPRLGASGLVGIEGVHLLEEAVRSGLGIDTVFVRAGAERTLSGLNLGSAPLVVLSDEILRAAVSTEAPQEVAALIEAPIFAAEQVLAPAPCLALVLAGLQDPGNLGTILRSAEAFGATGLIVLPGSVSVWNSKCVRASAGSVFRLPVVAVTVDECAAMLRAHGVRSIATVVRDGTPATAFDLVGPAALWIGNEGSGLPAGLARLCDAAITIPCPGPVESLNAAVAASVLLYEAARQRKARQS